MRKPHEYSTIRKEPQVKTDGTLSSLYDGLIKPAALVSILTLFFVKFDLKILIYLNESLGGNDAASLFITLFLFTIILGFRLIQSLFLAKRDYAHLENKLRDFVIFLFFASFASGSVLKAGISFSQMEGDPAKAALDLAKNQHSSNNLILIAYLIFGLVGILNFFWLFLERIPKTSDCFDYPFEKRIQLVNLLVFLLITSSLGCALIANLKGHPTAACLFVVATLPVILVNCMHSQGLTMTPKFLFHNKPDQPSSLNDLFNSVFGPYIPDSGKETIKTLFLTANSNYRNLRTARATHSDRDLLVNNMLKEFDYIFDYIFGGKSCHVQKAQFFKSMMSLGGGFCSFGFLNFYFIVEENKGSVSEKIGFFRVDTSHKNSLYSLYESLFVPLLIVGHFGIINFFPIIRRAKLVIEAQPRAEQKEIMITHLVIFDGFRKKGYARGFLGLFKNALRSQTNDIIVEKIIIAIRSSNTAALALLGQLGFIHKTYATSFNKDPLKESQVGKLLRYEAAV